jgi:hypothetical protein
MVAGLFITSMPEAQEVIRGGLRGAIVGGLLGGKKARAVARK